MCLSKELGGTTFGRMLQLAQRYGWHPAGTVSGERDWSGTYFGACGQVITAEDGARLADALEKALPDLADHSINEPRTPLNEPVALRDYFSNTERKEDLRTWIRLARSGTVSCGDDGLAKVIKDVAEISKEAGFSMR